MRCAPYDATVANQEGLRGFVADAKSRRDGIRYVAVRLYRHHRIVRVRRALVQVRHELVQRFGADAARKAVLEEKQRPPPRFSNDTVELIDSFYCRQVGMHLTPV